MLSKSLSKNIIFCDGACSGNPGPGGWAAIVRTADFQVIELAGRENGTTNNRMEMRALIEALDVLGGGSGVPAKVYTDSTYLIRGATQWLFGWQKKGWVTNEGKEVLNQDLWRQISSLVKKHKIEWHYVRGHTGVPGNERCDVLAVEYSQGRKVDLYKGSYKNYSVDLDQLPADTTLPAQSDYNSKPKQAFSYLSMVGLEVVRHKSWPQCETRVKGRSNAKFKKAMSESEELEILKTWGVRPDSVKNE